MTTPAGRWSIPAESRLTFDSRVVGGEQHQSTGADSDALPSDRRPCLPRSATHLPWGHHHGGGGSRAAPAFPPKATRMETFPLRAAAYDERLTLTEHLGELRARLPVSLALYGMSSAPLRLNERQSTPHEPLSG